MPRLRLLKPMVRTLALPKVGKTVALGNSGKRLRGKGNQQRRERILSKQPLCVDCLALGRVTAAQETDHEVPLWEGGPDTDENLTPRCVACHKAKSRREAARRYGGAIPRSSTDLP